VRLREQRAQRRHAHAGRHGLDHLLLFLVQHGGVTQLGGGQRRHRLVADVRAAHHQPVAVVGLVAG
jgi:hypothetical protein